MDWVLPGQRERQPFSFGGDIDGDDSGKDDGSDSLEPEPPKRKRSKPASADDVPVQELRKPHPIPSASEAAAGPPTDESAFVLPDVEVSEEEARDESYIARIHALEESRRTIQERLRAAEEVGDDEPEPEPEPKPEPVQQAFLRVQVRVGTAAPIKVKLPAKKPFVEKLITTLAAKYGLDAAKCRVRFDGDFITGEHTAEALELETDDLLELDEGHSKHA